MHSYSSRPANRREFGDAGPEHRPLRRKRKGHLRDLAAEPVGDRGGIEEAVAHAPRTSLLVAHEPITIRFPSGAWEYVVTERVPDVGDTLVRDGKTWTVAGVTGSEDGHRVITMAPELVKPPTLASLAAEARARRGS